MMGRAETKLDGSTLVVRIRKLLNEAGLVCSAGGWWRVRHN